MAEFLDPQFKKSAPNSGTGTVFAFSNLF
jgi:hypothetical protein